MDKNSVKSFKRLFPLELSLIVLAYLLSRLFSHGSMAFMALIILVFFIISQKRKYSLFQFSDLNGWLLLFASIVGQINTLFFNEDFSIIWSAYFIICPFFMYLIGVEFGKNIQSGRQLTFLLLLCSIAMALPHIGITFWDIRVSGLINPLRHLQLFDEEDQLATTARVIELSLCIGGIAYLFQPTIMKTDKRMKWFMVVVSIIAELCAIHYLSRTGILLFGGSLVLGFFFYRFNPRPETFLIIFALFVAIYIFWDYMQGSELVSLYEEREVAEDTDLASGGGRFSRWAMGLEGLFLYPFGDYVRVYDCHNLWLDYGRCYGLFPFLLLSFFSLGNIRYSITIVRDRKIEKNLRFCILLVTTIFFLGCLTECIHVGMPFYLYLYCMFCGVVKSLKKRKYKLYETVVH